MKIVRGTRPQRFTVVGWNLLEDDRLTWRARAIAIRLLANADGFTMTANDLAKRSPKEGVHAVRTALRELREVGYIESEKRQIARGRWITVTTVYDQPRHVLLDSQPPVLPGSEPEGSLSGSGQSMGACRQLAADLGDPTSTTETHSPQFGQPEAGKPKRGRCASRSTTTNTSTTTTTTVQTADLAWPRQLDERQVVVVGRLIEGLEVERQQLVLDELAGALVGSKPPKRLGSWVRAVAARIEQGEFYLDAGLPVVRERDRRAREMKEMATNSPSSLSARFDSDPEREKRHLAKIAECIAELKT